MLKIWIDDRLAYSHPLHDRKKRLLLLGGGSKETLTLPVSSGTHAVRIEVRSAAEQYDETKTVDGDFSPVVIEACPSVSTSIQKRCE